jgi:hypothetical protein
MRGWFLGRLSVVSVLFLVSYSCKQGQEAGVGGASELMTDEGTPLSADPTYAEWAFERQNELEVNEVYSESGMGLAGASEYTIIEGDVVVGTKETLNLASGGNQPWPNATVVYQFDANFPDRADVERAMQVWTTEAGIQFRERTNERDYVLIMRRERGCWSNLGFQGGEQYINLGEGCTPFGTKLHEIGHTLGLNHEQGRRDRDNYITINFQNIGRNEQSQFGQGRQDVGEYDYDSVMHYGKYAFSANGQPTIVTRNGARIGQRSGLSPLDVAAVKQIYGTTGTAPGSIPNGVIRAGQTTPDVTDPAIRNSPVAVPFNYTMPAPTTSLTTGCVGFGGFDWEERYAKQGDQCRDAKTYCTCWRTTAGTCGLYLPNGQTNVAGASMRAGETMCKESCRDVAANGAQYLRNNCNNYMVLINEAGRLELWDYSGTGRDVSPDTENL